MTDMINELKDKLKTEIEEADWNMLKPHHEKQAVFVVSSDLNLLDVGVAVAMDKSNMVKVWLDNNQLQRPTDEMVANFDKEEFKKICDFIIIQPYVLIQLKPEISAN